MLKGSRFIWYYWTQCLSANWSEDDEFYIFNGEIRAFGYLNKKGSHKRTVKVSKNKNLWVVNDKIENLDAYSKSQIWHYDNTLINFTSNDNKYMNVESINSSCYGQLEVGKAIAIPFNNEVETKIEYSVK
jgi:hypothetical protein